VRIACAELRLSCCLVRSDSSLYLTSFILGIVPEVVSNLSRTRAFLLHHIQAYDNVRKTRNDATTETHDSHDKLNIFQKLGLGKALTRGSYEGSNRTRGCYMTQKISLIPSQCYFCVVKFDGSELQRGKKKKNLSCKRCSSLIPE
jgi:hypothetical protein